MDYTPSPRFTVLQNVASALKTGQANDDALRQVINIVAKDLNDLLTLEQDETIFMDETSKARWEIMKSAILNYQKALSSVSRFLQDKNFNNLDKSMEEVAFADHKLYEIYFEMYSVFQKAKQEMEDAMFITCIYCGKKSHKDSRSCDSCGKTLTKGFQTLTEYSDIDEATGQIEAVYEDVEDYSNITKFKELASGVIHGTVAPKDLIKYTEELKGLFKGALNQFEGTKNIEKNLYPEIVDNINSSKQIIGELLAALDAFIAEIKAGDISHIEAYVANIDALANHLGAIKQNFINISQQLANG